VATSGAGIAHSEGEASSVTEKSRRRTLGEQSNICARTQRPRNDPIEIKTAR